MKQIFYSIIFILLVFTKAEAIDITATGSWNRTIDESDLAAGAGSDLIGIYESSVNATVLTVLNTTGNTDNWRIDVEEVTAPGMVILFFIFRGPLTAPAEVQYQAASLISQSGQQTASFFQEPGTGALLIYSIN